MSVQMKTHSKNQEAEKQLLINGKAQTSSYK